MSFIFSDCIKVEDQFHPLLPSFYFIKFKMFFDVWSVLTVVRIGEQKQNQIGNCL